MRYAILLSVLLMAGCAATKPVHMVNAKTGQTTTCGPYSTTDNYGSAEAAATQERQCIQDFQRQGYERAPN